MTDTRRRITLGQALNKQEETDSSIATELYVPGYRKSSAPGRPNRDDEVVPDSGQDILGAASDRIRIRYTDVHIDENNAYGRRSAYANVSNPSDADGASTLQSAWEKMESNFLTANPIPKREKGQATPERNKFFLDEREIESFRKNLLEDVLKEQNRFYGTEGSDASGTFFNPNAPNEDEAFPQGMFSVPKGTSEKPYGRYDASERVNLKKSDIEKATAKLLKDARNAYLGSFVMPKIDVSELRMARLLAETKESFRGLRLDGNGNIYKENKTIKSFGAGNKPYDDDEGFFATVSDFFEVDEFNSFFQYGTTGLVIKASAYALATSYLLGNLIIYNLLRNLDSLSDNDYGRAITGNLISTLTPPALIRLKNELGLKGEELQLKAGPSSILGSIFNAENFLKFNERIFNGWRVLFGFYEDTIETPSLTSSDGLSAFPDKVAQSPQFHFGLARLILRELQEVGSDPNAILSRTMKEPSNSFLLRLTATVYKLGVKVESKTQIEDDKKSLSKDESNFRKNRHRIFDSHENNSDYFNPLSLRYFDYLSMKDSIKNDTFDENSSYSTYASIESDFKRLSKEQVEAIESKIDADYVPFSIQDVRTNELMALPAFIDSVNDSFNVNYESTHGYGRTDPIYTYSKTERSVELSFNLVAMNHDDHDRMYEIVNKLTSMCYPQRSRGQLRVKDNNAQSFYQPFSQIQTASPLIRVRLGNMIHSNISERGYRQLFGNLLGEKFEAKEISNRLQKARLEADVKALEAEISLLEKLQADFKDDPFNLFLEIPVESAGGVIKVTNIPPRTRLNSTIQIDAGMKLSVLFLGTENNLPIYKIVNNSLPKNNQKFESYFKNSTVFNALNFSIAKNSLNFDESKILKLQTRLQSLKEAIEKIDSESSVDSTDSTDFLSSNNPIVRSFESTQGKGLACFIKSLSFDYNNTPWELDPYGGENSEDGLKSSVAPMRIKVNMSLAPIHDMPLGLSYDGTIMAPSHPVGKWALNS
jgi:hypothetical protein